MIANPLFDAFDHFTTSTFYYGVNGGISHDLDSEDIEYGAAYFRYLTNTSDVPLSAMPSEFDCSEWTLLLFATGIVLPLAKHINSRTNSTVTYNFLARVLDGGEDSTGTQRAASPLGPYGANGGQLQVIVDSTNPAYNTPEYIASKAKPETIISKLVRGPQICLSKTIFSFSGSDRSFADALD